MLLPWLLLLTVGLPLWPTRRMTAPLALAAGLGFAVSSATLIRIQLRHEPLRALRRVRQMALGYA